MDITEDHFYKHTVQAEAMYTEKQIYERLGSHPRILRVIDSANLYNGAMEFEYLPNGSVQDYVQANPGVPFRTILRWINQLAEGIAYLHSKNIVWSDCKLPNVLVTNDLDVVLCDFAGSSIDGSPAMIRPSAFYMLPSAVHSPNRIYPPNQDRFAFGTCVFLLLAQRWPLRTKALWEDFLTFEDCDKVEESFKRGEFDALSEEVYRRLAQVVQRCWRDEFTSTEDLVRDVREGCTACLERYENTDADERPKMYGYQPPKAVLQGRRIPTELLGVPGSVLLSLAVVAIALMLYFWT